MSQISIPGGNQGQDFVYNEKIAASIAEGLIRGNKGWRVMLNKPFTVSYDETNAVWIVQGKGSLLGNIVGAWGDSTIVIKKSGEIVAAYSTPD